MSESKYLDNIIEAYQKTNSNIFINASAGSGKTFCIKQLALITSPIKSVIFLAFNKSISEELKSKLPSHIDVSTIHAKAYGILRSNIKMNVKINELKNFIYCKQTLKTKIKDKKKENAYFFSIGSVIDKLKLNNLQPTEESINDICESYGFDVTYDQINDIIKVMECINKDEQDLNKSTVHNIDFTDMLYLCATKVRQDLYPKYDVVVCDECFPGDQFISTGDGKKRIKSMFYSHKKGEIQYVKSYNEKEKSFELKKVINVWEKGVKNLMKLEVGTKRNIILTPNHKMLTNNGWVEASKIDIGDFILSSSKNQPFHVMPNEDQIDLLIASSIGDGSVSNMSLNINRVKFIHGEPQKEYLYWKANILSSEDVVRKIEENGFSKKPAYVFNSKGYCLQDILFEKEYIIDNLNLKQLAIIYMDDGSYKSNTSRLYTFAYSQELIIKLSKKLISMGFANKVSESKSSSSNKPYWYIYFNVESSKELGKQIAKYVHPKLSYKLPKEFAHLSGSYWWDNRNSICGGMTVTNKIFNYLEEKVYDIEVEDNHNFIICSNSRGNNVSEESKTNGFIAHNCQDLSDVQQVIVLNLLKRNGRLISVGDEKQAINFFAGSSLKTFEAFKNRPNTLQFPLPITYRCPKKIVDLANEVFPEGTLARDSATEGEVRKGSLEEIEDGDMVLCRNNKPLIQVWLSLTKQRKKANILGKEFGQSIKNLFSQITSISSLDDILDKKIDELHKTGVSNPAMNKQYIALQEKCDIIRLLYDEFGTVSLVYEVIDEIFSNSVQKGITLTSIHKSKGLETDRVFFLNSHLIPSKFAVSEGELYAERCLNYVAITRVKQSLIYINIE